MSEKKKRWRPSLTAYRALERENEELRLKSAGGYDRALEAERDDLRERIGELEKEYYDLTREKEAVEAELCRMTAKANELDADYGHLRQELKRLRDRGLWERILNR